MSQTGAVVVAAGMSSRMGSFKPLLPLGSISAAEQIVLTLRQSGADPIVFVTGNQADLLEKHLSASDVLFVRNKNYAKTQMFDSAKIGLDFIQTKCERTLFTPVDVPLFTAKTVLELQKSSADIAIPVCNGREGHPLLLKCNQISAILKNDGKDGLRGALISSGAKIDRIPVNDRGILYDMDTPDDYERLKRGL